MRSPSCEGVWEEPNPAQSSPALAGALPAVALQTSADCGSLSIQNTAETETIRNGLSTAALLSVDLPAKRAEALRWVTLHPGRSARELERLSGLRKINARLSELEAQGVVEGTGFTECSVTGRVATAWRPTGNAPRPLVRRHSARQRVRQLEEEAQQLRAEVAQLRSALSEALAPRGQLLLGGVQ